MVREYQVVTRSDKNASDSLKHVREKIKARGRRQLWIQITAVASVVILFALSFAFFYMPELERESPVSAKVHAGGMKATLIVANGIQVDLMQDNLQDVVRQYGATVLEDKKNELRYDNVEVNEEIEEKPVYHTISTPVGENTFHVSRRYDGMVEFIFTTDISYSLYRRCARGSRRGRSVFWSAT